MEIYGTNNSQHNSQQLGLNYKQTVLSVAFSLDSHGCLSVFQDVKVSLKENTFLFSGWYLHLFSLITINQCQLSIKIIINLQNVKKKAKLSTKDELLVIIIIMFNLQGEFSTFKQHLTFIFLP